VPQTPQETKVLDLGCGSAVFVNELAAPRFQCYGVDISADAVKLGELQGVKNLGVISGHRIDFPESTFRCGPESILDMSSISKKKAGRSKKSNACSNRGESW
jgi:methylase of polypeptide subunit release factors